MHTHTHTHTHAHTRTHTHTHTLQVYITMSKSEKKESKAAVDLIGAYFGKSGASWIMQVGVVCLCLLVCMYV
jgi:hypothetical protein